MYRGIVSKDLCESVKCGKDGGETKFLAWSNPTCLTNRAQDGPEITDPQRHEMRVAGFSLPNGLGTVGVSI